MKISDLKFKKSLDIFQNYIFHPTKESWREYMSYISSCVLSPTVWKQNAWFVDYDPHNNVLRVQAVGYNLNDDEEEDEEELLIIYIFNPHEFLNDSKNKLRYTPTAYDDLDNMYDRVIYIFHNDVNGVVEKHSNFMINY